MQTVIKVVQQKGAIPTLTGVSLTAQNNLLQVRGTDLETGMEAQSICQGDIKTVLPAKMLLDIVSKLSNDTVEIIAQNGTAEIKCGRSHYTISAMDFENYPVFVMQGDEVSTKVEELRAKDMTRVNEVYDLSLEVAQQLAERRSFHPEVTRSAGLQP